MAIVSLLLSLKYSSAQSSFPKQLVGSWISVEYKEISTSDRSKKFRELVSPQILYFDSLGRCTIQSRMEYQRNIGKPVSQRMFGSLLQFTYTINKSKLDVVQVKDDNNLLNITFSGVPVSMLFERYK
jgi:hypothetical protein